MAAFNNQNALLYLPVMKKHSDNSVRLAPKQARLTLFHGPHVAHLSPQAVSDLAHVSLQQAYKWIAGTHPIPEATRLYLHFQALGILPHDAWNGWHIDERGKLIAGNGFSFHPDELLNFSYLKQLNGALQAEVARLRVENRTLRDAVEYFQARPTLSNVVRFPRPAKPQAQKKPG